MAPWLKIGRRTVGAGQPVYIVAEMSANHLGRLERAIALVRAAKQAGADAVKVQTYTPEAMTNALSAETTMSAATSPWSGTPLYELYRRGAMPWEWQKKLMEVANELGIDFFSSAFDESSVKFLQELGVPCYKIASFELIDCELIAAAARTGKPLLLSTGMASMVEIEEALQAASGAGACEIALLKCTSSYPAKPSSMNLRVIPEMSRIFQVPIGLSDHTLEPAVPIAAVALGACIIEKHLTIARSDGGLDAGFSLEPDEFAAMVRAMRTAEEALGLVRFGSVPEELPMKELRRSLYVAVQTRAGDELTDKNVKAFRPSKGIHPRHFHDVLGRTARRDICAGTPLQWDLIQ